MKLAVNGLLRDTAKQIFICVLTSSPCEFVDIKLVSITAILYDYINITLLLAKQVFIFYLVCSMRVNKLKMTYTYKGFSKVILILINEKNKRFLIQRNFYPD